MPVGVSAVVGEQDCRPFPVGEASEERPRVFASEVGECEVVDGWVVGRLVEGDGVLACAPGVVAEMATTEAGHRKNERTPPGYHSR